MKSIYQVSWYKVSYLCKAHIDSETLAATGRDEDFFKVSL